MTIKVSIIGCTGYVGEELIRLALTHPHIEITHLVSKSFAGQMLSEVYPNFGKAFDKKLEALDTEVIANDSDVVFTALPHGVSAKISAELSERGVKVIDLSGDFRYDDVSVYEAWYKVEHQAKNFNDIAVYGMCELYTEQIAKAELVANPGCYTTGAILPVYPLLKADIINPEGIIIDAKSGVSGAGRKESLALSFSETHESFKAYGLATHRHTSEIEQELSKAAGQDIIVSFTPHLLPIKRGILETIYATLKDGVTREDIITAYACYDEKPFVHVMEKGLPEIKHVAGSNSIKIGFAIDQRLNRLIVVSALDNLVKGAGGQAIQNMNVMFGLKETEGLTPVGLYL